ncbi:SRPBCC domain-containing protein [Neogemmobacter tilapiae]|uniref:ATPase n=1 Tax=Neogemmobacter tilapiae TaxID=875041 RepID=A0A918TY19_9RHOB|nr:SRPBCC domain-containing protein [Gemmobacter tilapiae]GHC61773.1 ATPase [Gemmobacter tilapiae]
MHQLQATASGAHEILFTRRFDAPLGRVWQAMTDPALIPKWLWARVAPMTLCEQDFRVGGGFRWVWTRADGGEMGVTGRFLEIEAPHRMVHSETFDEDWTGGETRVTTELVALGDNLTEMRMIVWYSSDQARDAAMATAMVEGMDEAYQRLDAVLEGWS